MHARLVWPKPGSDQTVTPKPEGTVTVTPDTVVRRVVKLNDPSVPLKLRSKPSTSSEIKGTLPHGTVLEVTEDLGDWIGVRTQEGRRAMYTSCIPCPMMSLILIHSLRERRAAPKSRTARKAGAYQRPGGTVKPENTPEPEVSGTQEPENTPDIPAPEVSGRKPKRRWGRRLPGKSRGCSF